MSKNQRNNRLYLSSSQNARSLRTEYRKISNEAFSSLYGGTDALPTLEYMRSNSGDRLSSALSARTLMMRMG